MSFVQVWFTGYYNPVKMIEELRFTGRRSEFDQILSGKHRTEFTIHTRQNKPSTNKKASRIKTPSISITDR
jgi:hypothetical protein